MQVALKPLSQRDAGAEQIIARLRPKLAKVPGSVLVLTSVQDIRVGARMSNAQYQYTLQADDLSDLRTWAPKLTEALKSDGTLIDGTSDYQDKGLETELVIDRASAIPGSPLDLEDLKIIVLMVFWSLGEEPDALILDELFVDAEDRLIH